MHSYSCVFICMHCHMCLAYVSLKESSHKLPCVFPFVFVVLCVYICICCLYVYLYLSVVIYIVSLKEICIADNYHLYFACWLYYLYLYWERKEEAREREEEDRGERRERMGQEIEERGKWKCKKSRGQTLIWLLYHLIIAATSSYANWTF